MKHIFTVLLSILSFATFGQNWDQTIKAVASDRENLDRFGTSVSIDGNMAIVGAYTEDHNTAGLASMSEAGSAYVFELIGGIWIETGKLIASDRAAGDRFGYSVSISANKVIVGAYTKDELSSGGANLADAGSAYVFELTGGVWTEIAKLVSSDIQSGDGFGASVNISGDKAIIGAYLEDHDAAGGTPQTDAGSAYIFEYAGGVWTETAKLVASDRSIGDYFGWNVSIGDNKVIIGAYLEDHLAGGALQTDIGSAYIFELNGGVWSETAKLEASEGEANDHFGFCVSISGDKVAIGADQADNDATGANPLGEAGSGYVYELTGGVWTETVKLVASDRAAGDEFGRSISISGNRILVGAKLEDHIDSAGVLKTNAGAAYLFELNGGVWAETVKLVASDGSVNDYFGRAVGISGNKLIVGAYANDADADGLNPLTDAGAVYIFEYNNPLGLIKNDLGNKFQLYPNPATSEITISNFDEEIGNITIIDVTGKVMMSFDPKIAIIDVSDLTTGIYFVRIEINKAFVCKKFIKK